MVGLNVNVRNCTQGAALPAAGAVDADASWRERRCCFIRCLTSGTWHPRQRHASLNDWLPNDRVGAQACHAAEPRSKTLTHQVASGDEQALAAAASLAQMAACFYDAISLLSKIIGFEGAGERISVCFRVLNGLVQIRSLRRLSKSSADQPQLKVDRTGDAPQNQPLEVAGWPHLLGER